MSTPPILPDAEVQRKRLIKGGLWLGGGIFALIFIVTAFTEVRDLASPPTTINPPAVVTNNSSSGSSASSPAQRFVNQYGGQLSAYQRILGMSDCNDLQAQFDIAAANHDLADAGTAEFKWTLGYMTAADDRLESAGCY